jgi:hypothetical protein
MFQNDKNDSNQSEAVSQKPVYLENPHEQPVYSLKIGG